VNDLTLWNELTRREQRIMIKLFGGGSPNGDGPIETVNLLRLGLIHRERINLGWPRTIHCCIQSATRGPSGGSDGVDPASATARAVKSGQMPAVWRHMESLPVEAGKSIGNRLRHLTVVSRGRLSPRTLSTVEHHSGTYRCWPETGNSGRLRGTSRPNADVEVRART
jgi:hypothetical protein